MFASIRRHQKWLWAVVIVTVIISFVVYLDPSYSAGRRSGGRGGRGGIHGTEFGSVYGRSLSREELLETYQEVRLRFRLMAGRWPEEDETSRMLFNPDRQVQERLVMLENLRRLNIQVSDQAVVEWIADVFQDRQGGGFNLDLYQQFLQRVLAPAGYRESDFQRYARHEVGIQYLVRLHGLPGAMVSPGEATEAYRREHEQVTAEAAVFSSSNYLAGVQVTDPALETFFTNNLARYRTPEKVQVSYVRFASTNHLAEADAALQQRTNLTAQLQAEYQRRGPDFFKDAGGKTLGQEAALEKIREEVRKGLAMVEAQKRAMAFAEELYALYEKEPRQLENLERLAAAKGLVAAVTEPFSRFESPAGLNVLDTFGQTAFQLSAEQPMATEPVLGEDAVYIVAFKQRVASEAPPLASVRDRVVEDFRRQESVSMARRAGQAFQAAVVAGSAAGRTFESVCEELKVQPLKLPAFAVSATSLAGWEGRVDFSVVRQAASGLAAGKTSDFLSTRDGGVVVRVVARQAADEAKLQAELPAFRERLQEERQRLAFGEWFRRESEVARVTGLPQFKRSSAAETP